MKMDILLGLQWGDEGKGKIVDLLMPRYDLNVRFQGGNNAGHTVKFGSQHFALHLIPSGILHAGKICILGNGMVVDPEALATEMEYLKSHAIELEGRIFISDRVQIILPQHRLLDAAREKTLGEKGIGTTGRGIGPAYEAKVSRYGIRASQFSDPDNLRERLSCILPDLNGLLKDVYDIDAPSLDETVAWLMKYRDTIVPYLADTAVLINSMCQIGKKVMFEGAQGAMLDVDHGSYPYVTASNCTVGGILTGSGASPKHFPRILGILKAYTTRVGGGPFPTELKDKMGDRIRGRGNEFGTTTGRPRRVGWLDLVVGKYSVLLNGVDEIALTKLDVLDELEEISVCLRYRVKGTTAESIPANALTYGRAVPEYERLPGWNQDTSGITSWDQLPQNAKKYVEYIQDHLQVKISLISTGPRREETINLRD